MRGTKQRYLGVQRSGHIKRTPIDHDIHHVKAINCKECVVRCQEVIPSLLIRDYVKKIIQVATVSSEPVLNSIRALCLPTYRSCKVAIDHIIILESWVYSHPRLPTMPALTDCIRTVIHELLNVYKDHIHTGHRQVRSRCYAFLTLWGEYERLTIQVIPGLQVAVKPIIPTTAPTASHLRQPKLETVSEPVPFAEKCYAAHHDHSGHKIPENYLLTSLDMQRMLHYFFANQARKTDTPVIRMINQYYGILSPTDVITATPPESLPITTKQDGKSSQDASLFFYQPVYHPQEHQWWLRLWRLNQSTSTWNMHDWNPDEFGYDVSYLRGYLVICELCRIAHAELHFHYQDDSEKSYLLQQCARSIDIANTRIMQQWVWTVLLKQGRYDIPSSSYIPLNLKKYWPKHVQYITDSVIRFDPYDAAILDTSVNPLIHTMQQGSQLTSKEVRPHLILDKTPPKVTASQHDLLARHMELPSDISHVRRHSSQTGTSLLTLRNGWFFTDLDIKHLLSYMIADLDNGYGQISHSRVFVGASTSRHVFNHTYQQDAVSVITHGAAVNQDNDIILVPVETGGWHWVCMQSRYHSGICHYETWDPIASGQPDQMACGMWSAMYILNQAIKYAPQAYFRHKEIKHLNRFFPYHTREAFIYFLALITATLLKAAYIREGLISGLDYYMSMHWPWHETSGVLPVTV